MTTKSAAGCFEKSQGSAFSRFATALVSCCCLPIHYMLATITPGLRNQRVPKCTISLLTSVLLDRPPARVTAVEPLAALAAHIAPAILVAHTDARVRSDAVLGLAQARADAVPEARQALVGRVHAARQAVADELDPAAVVGDLDEALALGDVDGGQLDAVGPVGDAQLKGQGGDRVGQVGAGRVGRDEEVCRAGGDVGELPVQPGDAVAYQHAVRGEVAEADGYRLAGVAEPDPRCAVSDISTMTSTREGEPLSYGRAYLHQDTYFESHLPLYEISVALGR